MGKSKVTKEAPIPYVGWESSRVQAGTVESAAANKVEPLPRPGEFVLFVSFLDRGLALPSSDFFRQLLSFYNIKVSDLGPHSVQQIALFVALCECYLGCPPYFSSGENFIDMALPKKAQSQWRKYWFYAAEYTPPSKIAIPDTPEPSVPRLLNVRSPPKDQEEVVKGCAKRFEAKESGLTAANITKANDRTRSSREWDEAVRKALAKVTTAVFTSFDDGLQPFSEDKPAPKRWQVVANHLPPLAGKEPPEMTEGEDDEVDDEGDRTESDSEAREYIRPRGAKRGRRPPRERAGSKRKVLTRPAPVTGAAATKAAEARKAAELKKAAEAKRTSADPADLSSAREETVAESQAADATASPQAGGRSYPRRAWVARRGDGGCRFDEARDPIVVPSSTKEEPSAAARRFSGADEGASDQGRRGPGSPQPTVLPGRAPSTEAVMQVEVKRLTALVEEAAREKALAEAREGYVKESLYRRPTSEPKQEEAKKKAKAEVAT
ncbi:hypothetical protein QYE76_018158 [Lolium multiflorum]|uniref:Transposase (putative) gypsy type domain-containing protein n=1 Tax=Lolium multiflorum TaxID=4521 RepID=A0AAD8Q7B6_LOLMU|nr:hypothetical protein QYE76_018158 [Lolium multiflorum]